MDNIQAANDRVVRMMDKMDLPNLHRRSQDKLHTASDGQKFEVRTESLNANYSFKYFGKGHGISAYTFIDERNLLWHSLVFSAAQRESAYVIDGLMRNDVIKSDIHSTDTHGYSEAIFAAAHLLGFSYAPRIKNLKKQNLYIFKSRRNIDCSEWKITPDKYVNVSNQAFRMLLVKGYAGVEQYDQPAQIKSNHHQQDNCKTGINSGVIR